MIGNNYHRTSHISSFLCADCRFPTLRTNQTLREKTLPKLHRISFFAHLVWVLTWPPLVLVFASPAECSTKQKTISVNSVTHFLLICLECVGSIFCWRGAIAIGRLREIKRVLDELKRRRTTFERSGRQDGYHRRKCLPYWFLVGGCSLHNACMHMWPMVCALEFLIW